jgi:hypothetical protein
MVVVGACSLDRAGLGGSGEESGGASESGSSTGGQGPGGQGPGGQGGASTTGGSTTSASSGSGGGTPCTIFPADNAWNTDISGAAVDALSDEYIATIGVNVPLHAAFGQSSGIPHVSVDSSVPKSSVEFYYDNESDNVPYPIPMNPPTDGAGRILMIHQEECVLYELLGAELTTQWDATAGAIWDLKTNATRPPGWTSADGAGLPIYPGLVRFEEAMVAGEIRHALRYTTSPTQRAYAFPANHYASDDTDPNLPPMGLRLRLKASVNIDGYPPEVRVILTALKKYGMFLASNGPDLHLSGAPNSGWNEASLLMMEQLHAGDFEAVATGTLTTSN